MVISQQCMTHMTQNYMDGYNANMGYFFFNFEHLLHWLWNKSGQNQEHQCRFFFYTTKVLIAKLSQDCPE